MQNVLTQTHKEEQDAEIQVDIQREQSHHDDSKEHRFKRKGTKKAKNKKDVFKKRSKTQNVNNIKITPNDLGCSSDGGGTRYRNSG